MGKLFDTLKVNPQDRTHADYLASILGPVIKQAVAEALAEHNQPARNN